MKEYLIIQSLLLLALALSSGIVFALALLAILAVSVGYSHQLEYFKAIQHQLRH